MPMRKLAAVERSIRGMEEALGAGFWTYDCKSKALYWSRGLFLLLGLQPDSIMPDFSVSNGLVHPDDRLEQEEVLALARHPRQAERVVRIIRPDGQMIWVQSQMEAQFDRSGQMISVHGIMHDVTRQQMERERARNDRMLAQSLKKLTEGAVWRASPDGFLLEQGHWTRLTGTSLLENAEKDPLEAIHPEDRSLFREAWAEGRLTRKVIQYRVRIRNVEGTYKTFETRAIPIQDDEGNILEWHGMSIPAGSDLAPVSAGLGSMHIRGARALLDWSGPELAKRSGISFSTVKRLEKNTASVKPDSVAQIISTLMKAGIRFATQEDGEIWLALSERQDLKSSAPVERL